MLPENSVHCLDCFELLAQLDDQSVDLILADPPYNSTKLHFEVELDLPRLFSEFKRIIKPKHAIVLTGDLRFGMKMIAAAGSWFRYELILRKSMPTGFLNANRQPLFTHEYVFIFAEGQTPYYPQFGQGKPYIADRDGSRASHYGKHGRGYTDGSDGKRYPVSVIDVTTDNTSNVHPTQKSVTTFSYLIKTYTLPNELVIDPFVGSGTTALAARNTNRRYIVGDSHQPYIDITNKRLSEPYTPLMFGDEPTAPKPEQTSFMED